MKTKKYSPHIFSLCALFVLGNAVISMPVSSGVGWFLIFSITLSLVLMFFIKMLIILSAQSKIIFYITAIVVGVAAIYGATTAFWDYIKFLKAVQMPQASITLLSAVLLGVVIAFLSSRITAVYKYSLFVAIIGAVVIVICFLGAIKSFDFSLLKTIFKRPDFEVKDFLRWFSSVVVLLFLANSQERSVKPIFCGVALGFTALLLCLSQATLTLGNATDVTYPYLKAVGVISSGSLFTRLDGLVYFLFFVTSLIKMAICIKVIKKCWMPNQ